MKIFFLFKKNLKKIKFIFILIVRKVREKRIFSKIELLACLIGI